MSTKYSYALSNALISAIFIRNEVAFLASGLPVTYTAKPGQEGHAAKTWAVHGICSYCHHRSISAGACVQCGVEFGDQSIKGYLAEQVMAEQCDFAHEIILSTK